MRRVLGSPTTRANTASDARSPDRPSIPSCSRSRVIELNDIYQRLAAQSTHEKLAAHYRSAQRQGASLGDGSDPLAGRPISMIATAIPPAATVFYVAQAACVDRAGAGESDGRGDGFPRLSERGVPRILRPVFGRRGRRGEYRRHARGHRHRCAHRHERAEQSEAYEGPIETPGQTPETTEV
jgi:hypothetical protein